MNYKPPLRDYMQMVRIIRDQPNNAMSFQMGNAYGNSHNVSSTDRRIRTLNEMNMPSTTLRRPGPAPQGGELSTRASSTHFHQLGDSTQDYLRGTGGAQAIKRSDGNPGTKLLTELSKGAFSKEIHTPPTFQSFASADQHQDQGKQTDDKASSHFNAFK